MRAERNVLFRGGLNMNKHYFSKSNRDIIPQSVPDKTRGRTFPSALKGSLTIEASLVLPVFLFFMTAIIHFLLLISLQSDIQLRIDEAAREIGKRAYVADESEVLSLVNGNSLTIRKQILSDELTDRINNSSIIGGVSGFHTILSSYNDNSGILDIIATYKYRFPYLPARIGTFSIMQRCYCRAWIGAPLDESTSSGAEDEQIVYITPTGRAYHTSPSCNYLDLSIKSVLYSEVDSLRNLGGSRYGRCSCAAKVTDGKVYVTSYGILYHLDLTCSKLKRTVKAVPISQVGGRHLCPKCAGNN